MPITKYFPLLRRNNKELCNKKMSLCALLFHLIYDLYMDIYYGIIIEKMKI